jgi:predicted  nucleic acid-binding Zn-ribbon protein
MKPVVEECDLRVHSVVKSQHDLSTQIEHLACELDRFMGACGEQREALAFDPYVEKLKGCKSRLANVNTTLNAVEQRMQRMQRQVGVDR